MPSDELWPQAIRRNLKRVKSLRGRTVSAAIERFPSRFLPDGWQYGPPDFVGVGAQRSGTTWWFSLISAHPAVFRIRYRRKELHFFDRFQHRDVSSDQIEQYHRQFVRPAGRIVGEWTPAYSLDVWTPPLLARAAPEARMLVILRDPISRFRSGLTFNLTRDRSTDKARLAYYRGLYHEQLARLVHAFGRERLLVLQYERCQADPVAELRRTYAFLGLDEDFVPTQIEKRRNVAGAPLVRLAPGLEETLRYAYSEDARRLAADFPEIDLALWPSVSD